MTIETLMREHGVRRIERHEPDDLLNYEWFAIELGDSRMIGTGPTVADALAKAEHIREHLGRKAA